MSRKLLFRMEQILQSQSLKPLRIDGELDYPHLHLHRAVPSPSSLLPLTLGNAFEAPWKSVSNLFCRYLRFPLRCPLDLSLLSLPMLLSPTFSHFRYHRTLAPYSTHSF
jgi:hypothetical protein